MVTTAWRRVMLPYLALLAIAVGDALAVGQRVLGGHLGVAAQLMPVVAALLLGAAPWRMTEGFGDQLDPPDGEFGGGDRHRGGSPPPWPPWW